MKKITTIAIIFVLLIIAAIAFTVGSRSLTPEAKSNESENYSESMNIQPGATIDLPEPVTDGQMSLEKTLTLRRSIRSYTEEPLTVSEVSQLLWSAQGITNERGYRTAPSAGATFPLEMFLVVSNVEGMEKGLYHYHPEGHRLEFIREADLAEPLYQASLSQSMILEGGVVLVFGAIFERTTERYGERGIRYVHNEIGHASQNVHLQAAALDLGTVVIGAYNDDEVEEALRLGDQYRVLYLMPVGNQ